MTRILAVAGSCGLGEDPARWLEGLREGRPALEAPEPARPRRVERDLWRRMGRLEQLAVSAAARALGSAESGRLGVVWGSGIGSLPASRVFRRSLDALGPDGASPAAFQVSVHNAPAGFIALALGLRGPAESVFAGGATGLAVLLAAEGLMASGAADRVLAVAGDARCRDSLLACKLGGHPEPGDAVCALLLEPGEGEGASLSWVDPETPPDLARRRPYPGERPLLSSAGLAPEEALGTTPSMGLLCVGALARGGGGVLREHADGLVLAARVR